MGYRVVICYHSIKNLLDTAKLATKMQLYCKFIGIGVTTSQSFFVYLQHNCKSL